MLNEMHSTIIILKKGGTPIIVKIPQTNANTSKMKYNSFILKKRKKSIIESLYPATVCTQVGDPSRHKTALRLAKSCLGSSGTFYVLLASAPADVMCWQCVWFSPVAGWPASVLNILGCLVSFTTLEIMRNPSKPHTAIATRQSSCKV